MFNSLGNLAELMKNAGKIKESLGQANETLGRVEVEATADAPSGSVTVRANGRLEIISVTIAPGLLAAVDARTLGALIAEATNQALVLSKNEAAKALTGGISIPGFPGLGSGGA
ncbi:YbaB/EbfC family nucleoid-associated protein [Isosphaeraceae bacterium EP7]